MNFDDWKNHHNGYRKTRVPESIFNKVKLTTLLKRDSHTCFSVNFSRTRFLKNTSRKLLLNSDDRKNPHDCWSKILFFSLLRFLILNDGILIDLLMGCRNFIFKLSTKQQRISLSLYFAIP